MNMHWFSQKIMRAAATSLLALTTLFVSTSQPTVSAATQQQVSSAYWLAEYFNNTDLSGNPVLRRTSRVVQFNWGKGSPSRSIGVDNFSVRFSRPLIVAAGSYVVRARADDGVRVYIDNRLVIDEWRDGPPRDSEATVQLNGQHLFRVEYYERTGGAYVRLQLLRSGSAQVTSTWRGEYFNNAFLTGQPALVRDDRDVNFDFGSGSPGAGVSADSFSARWTRRINFTPGYYVFTARVDDGVRVYVGDRILIDQFAEGGQRDLRSASVFLSGETPVRVEYFDRSGSALIQLSYAASASPLAAPTATAIPFFNEWRADYFNNASFAGSPVVTRNDRDINFNFGAGSPDPRVPVDNFSARWTRTIVFAPGNYRFTATVDDGVRVTVAGRVVIDALVDGGPRTLTGDATVSGPTEVRVEYLERGGGGLIQFGYDQLNVATTDWRGEYFNNASLQGSPAFVRGDRDINFDWSLAAPDPRVSNDNFSVRWTRRQAFAAGTYRIDATMDDGLRVYVDGNLVLDQWSDASIRSASAVVNLNAGEHDLRVEYYERAGSATARVNITSAPSALPTAAP
jgi:hypothetical protein